MRCEGYMVVTKDVEAAKRFYTELLDAQIVLDLGKHVIFQEGFFLLHESDWLVFADLQAKDVSYRHHTGLLVFEVDDMGEFMEHLKKFPAVCCLHPVKEHPWGRNAVRFYDPDGHIIEVGESMKVVVKRFLRQGMTVQATACKSEFPVEYVLQCQEELHEEQSLAERPGKNS